eukprot:Rhum_TRINITY_DN6153_c0_g1::Rhum_TRINITY_DN6153_c0_g1_i1::g.19251::m.19251/K12968/ADAR, ADAR1; double-stranded RNA-specific adenosine deaminase
MSSEAGDNAPPAAAAPLRHAEKRRDACCPLADVIAACALSKWRTLVAEAAAAVPAETEEGESGGRGRPVRLRNSGDLTLPQQTVVAALVRVRRNRCDDDGGDALDAAAEVECLTLGQGTKFLSRELLAEEGDAGAGGADDEGTDSALRTRVADSHAEVLARRALKLYLYAGGELLPDDELAFYTSSAPCGNSCVKKWAKNTTKGGPDTLPHPTFNVSQRREGQVAVLVKGEHLPTEGAERTPATNGLRVWSPSGVAAPVGTTPAAQLPAAALRTQGYVASCSDKMATWAVCGLQGGAYAALHPARCAALRAAYVVVGRKFGDATLRRALCCRLTAAKGALPDGAVRHPLVLRTSLCLDESAYEGDEGAAFDSALCCWWAAPANGGACEGLRCIDGTTGLAPDGSQSPLSTRALAAVFRQRQEGGSVGYAAAKEASPQVELKRTLFSHPKLLSPYPSRRYVEPVRRARKVAAGSSSGEPAAVAATKAAAASSLEAAGPSSTSLPLKRKHDEI